MSQKTRNFGLWMAVTLIAVLLASPVRAGGSQVTQGSFTPFELGPILGYSTVNGQATMIRTGSGMTIVVVTAGGLEAGLSYGSHVHNRACNDAGAGGHYSFGDTVPGGALDGTEIWPGPFTSNPAGNAAGFTQVGATAGLDAVSVVIHAPGGAKIACADLR